MSLAQLFELVGDSAYAEDLRELRLAELFAATGPPVPMHGPTSHAVMRVFCLLGDEWLASSYFVRNLGLRRWTAQKICAELAERGLLERRGRTSGTRYRLLRARAH